MRRPILSALLALLALVAVPAAALAKPPKISPHPSPVSEAGVATVEVANPNTYALRGATTVTVGSRAVLRRSVRLAKRSIKTIRLRFNANAVQALRAADGRARIALRVRRPGGRTSTARRKLTLRLPSGGAPAPAPRPGTGGDGGGANPAPPASNRWVGRMGTAGPYDDLELTLAGGRLQITRTPFVPVSCFENGGSYRSSTSFELFTAPGPWTVGTDGLVAKQGIAVNQLVGSGARTINYKVTKTAQLPGRLTGTLGMSFFDSKYDVFTSTILFINCAGSQSFEAVPAG
jgi:hypothetical protein